MFFMQIHDLLTPTQVQKLYISFTLYVLSLSIGMACLKP